MANERLLALAEDLLRYLYGLADDVAALDDPHADVLLGNAIKQANLIVEALS